MDAPTVRVNEIVADEREHDCDPVALSENFTGTTPRFDLKTLDPSALIGGSMTAPARVHNSAELRIWSLYPPTTRTAPDGNKVAV